MRSILGTIVAFGALLAAATALAMPVVPAPLPGHLSMLVAAANKETHTVRGYVRKDGTYVKPHRQTDPDANKYNNYSTEGNMNPFTGEKGDVDPTKKKVKAPTKPTKPTKPKTTTTKTTKKKKKPTTLNPALSANQTTTKTTKKK
jgi:hypothetical protein